MFALAIRSSWSASTVLSAAVVVVCALVGVVAGPGASAAAGNRGKPDLVVAKLKGLPTTAVAGDDLPVKVVVRNQGKRKSPRSSVSFVVSEDQSRSRNDLALPLTIKVPRIKPGATKVVAGTFTAPAEVEGARYVVACVAKVTGERKKRARNNCRAGANPIDIRPQATDSDLPRYYVGTAQATHVYTVTTSATDSIGATYTQEERQLTATGVVFELASTSTGSLRYVAVDGELEWQMGGGYTWPYESCDFHGRGTVPIGARPGDTPYSTGYITLGSTAAGLEPGATYSLSSFHDYNGAEAPSFDLDCTEFDQTRNYEVDPWLTVHTDIGESEACEWASTTRQFTVTTDGSLTGANSCRNVTTRDLPNGTHHEYTFESRVSWDLEPMDALPDEAER